MHGSPEGHRGWSDPRFTMMSIDALRVPSARTSRIEFVAMPVVLAVAVGTGLALALEPRAAMLPAAALVCALLLTDGRARIVFVVFGGLLILQREESLDASKLVFLAGFGAAFVGAVARVGANTDSAAFRAARPLLKASVVFGGLVLVSSVVAYANAIPPVEFWLRDASPYLLFASAPLFALDAQAALTRRGLVALLVVAGSFGALSFAVTWLDRRHIVSLGAEYLGLATHFVPAALFAFGMSMALQGRKSRWLLLSALILTLLLVTGTRTNLALFVAPLAIAFGARRHLVARTVRLAFLGPLAIALTVALGVVLVQATDANEELLTKRIEIFKQTGSAEDASYVERVRQARAAWDVFLADPVLGRGPGTVFQWETYDGQPAASFLLDTPLTYPAKFGLVGIAVLAFVVLIYARFTRAMLAGGVPGVAGLALLGYLAVVVISTFAYSPLQDKGFSFALMMMLALVLAEVEQRDRVPVVRRVVGERASSAGGGVTSATTLLGSRYRGHR